MKAVVLVGPGEVRVDDAPPPQPQGRTLVSVREVGICGTDMKMSGSVPVAYPRVLGHEMVGEVIEPGPDARFRRGDRVLVDPSVSCGWCVRCRRDEAHLCGQGGLMGRRDLDGVFAELVAVDEGQLLPLPEDFPFTQGPLLQILGTCVYGQSLVQAEPGQVALVNGLGVSGLLHVQLLRARGVDTVVGITRSDSKLKLARQLGATATATPDGAQELVDDITAGEGANLLVECSGTLAGLRTVVQLARPGATVLLFGTISETNGDFPYYLLYYKELSLLSSRGAVPRDYAAAIEHVAAHRVRLEPLL